MQQEVTLVEEEEDLCEEEDALFDCKREEYFYLSTRIQMLLRLTRPHHVFKAGKNFK